MFQAGVVIYVILGLIAASAVAIPSVLPSLLLNLAMLHLGVAATLRQIPRVLLTLPVAVYCGWPLAAALNRSQTPRAIEEMMAKSRLDTPVAPDADLIFAPDDPLAEAARRFLVGGRIFKGSDEIQIFRSPIDDSLAGTVSKGVFHVGGGGGRILSGPSEIQVFKAPAELAAEKCDNREASFGRLAHRGLLGGAIFECVFRRTGQAPPSGLFLSRSEVGNWPGQHFTHYKIDEMNSDGTVKRVGEFYFGYSHVWQDNWPFFIAGCGQNFCEIEPVRDNAPGPGAYYAFAGRERDFVPSNEPDFNTVRGLAEVLGRATRKAPPQL